MEKTAPLLEHELSKYFPAFKEKTLREQMIKLCAFKSFKKDMVLLEEGTYVKMLPLVLKGSIKIMRQEGDKEILLYYIQGGQSCIMCISACIHNEKSPVKVVTEEDTEVILVPLHLVNNWLKIFSTWNTFVIDSYKSRFEDMLDAFNTVVFQKMDARILNYLKQKQLISNTNVVKTTHQQIANELATARVVVSRILKDLEHRGKIKQGRGEIKLIES